jgi:hypothetical protein
VRKLLKGGNYSRAETIRGNRVNVTSNQEVQTENILTAKMNSRVHTSDGSRTFPSQDVPGRSQDGTGRDGT